MTSRSGSVRVLVAASAVVVAVCVVVVTTRVTFFGLPLAVTHEKVFDKDDLAIQVHQLLQDRYDDISSVVCPSSVTVKSGVTFECTVEHEDGPARSVQVTVTDTDSGAIEVGNLGE